MLTSLSLIRTVGRLRGLRRYSEAGKFREDWMLQQPTIPVESPSRRIPVDELSIDLSTELKPKPVHDKANLPFGKYFSDHMLEVDFCSEENRWLSPRIVPYHKFVLPPSASALHYGISCFEGMKAYLDDLNRIRLFRPEMNMRRFNRSASRLGLPNFHEGDLLKLLKRLLILEKDWIPEGDDDYSLYIRPVMLGTSEVLGVAPSGSAKIFVIMSPSGAYFKSGFGSVSLFANRNYVRAWPGGAGDSKVAGNYAPTLRVAETARQFGCSQVLWLLGDLVQEAGTMNVFFLWRNKEGRLELVTPPLSGTILPGVTRQSVLDLTQHWPDLSVIVRDVNIREVCEAVNEGRMVEAFGAGTAATIAPIDRIHFEGEDFHIPLDPENPSALKGPFATHLSKVFHDLQRGRNFEFPVAADWCPIVMEEDTLNTSS